jgi:hypothetical protein
VKRRLAAVLLVACLAVVPAGCDAVLGPADSPGPTAIHSGVRGIVLISPTCPVVTSSASPCIKPYVARLVITDTNGAIITTVTSGADGHFEVPLAPGDYTIQPVPGGDPLPNAQAVFVSVVDDSYADVEVDYDTGIR